MSLKKFSKKIRKNGYIRYLLPLFVLGFSLLGLSVLSKTSAQRVYPMAVIQRPNIPVCPGPVASGYTRCHSRVVTNSKGIPLASSGPSGYGPLQFHTAYNLPSNASSNSIIAIVDAYDDPNAYSDLTTYSNQYGIPVLPQCSGPVAGSSVPCFSKVDQNGGTNYPKFNSGWALEISLDVQIAHAICQNCSILLVEARSNSFSNLLTAENQAVSQGALVVSNSWSGGEFSSETAYDSYFNHPGVVFAFASGDSGYSGGTQYPAASQYAVSVGGTTLQLNSNNTYYSETVWNGTGSGCSAYEQKPSWQKDTGCANRTLNDVSADADPNTGAAVYDSAGYQGQYGWFTVGGTSLATPLTGGVYALAGVTPNIYEASVVYKNASALHDILSGNNGTCSPAYLCTAGSGYDGPTGNGTPNGLTGFGGSSSISTPTPTSTSSPTPTPTASPTPAPSGTPSPVSVLITSPTNGSTVPRHTAVTITTDTSSNVSQVVFTVNGSTTCTVTSAPFNCAWHVPGTPSASYTITATATDGLGDSAYSTVNVTAQ